MGNGNFTALRGYMKMAKGKNDEAYKLFSKAYEKGMENPNYLSAYASLLMKKREFDKAVEIFRRALLYAPKENKMLTGGIKLNLATCYWKLGDQAEALERAESLYKKQKTSALYGLYGYLLMASGDYDKALEVNLEGYEYDDEDAAVIDNLGQLYFRMGDKEKAKEYFEKSLAIRDNMVDSIYFLAQICEEEGDINRAMELMEDAVEIDIPALSTVTEEDVKKSYENIKAKLKNADNAGNDE